MPTRKITYRHLSQGFKAGGLLLTLFLLGSCGVKHVNTNIPTGFDQDAERRINKDIQKRQALLASNPNFIKITQELGEGKLLLSDGKPKEAYAIFDGILLNKNFSKFPEYKYAKYYKALALRDQGIYYGALLYFIDILENESLLPHTHDALTQAIRLAQHIRDDELIVYLASKISKDKVPRNMREEFRYFIAKSLYLSGKKKSALRLLQQIPFKNRLYLAAMYLTGAILVDADRLDKASEYFRKVSNSKAPVKYYDEKRIKQIANLALARIFYEKQNYPLAVLYYQRVDRDDEFFAEALYESSWSLFKMHKFEESLSVIHSVHSPFIDQTFYIKSYLLKSAILIELCHYEAAIDTLSSVETRFVTLAQQIDAFAKNAKNPKDYYPHLRTPDPQIKGGTTYLYKDLFQLAGTNKDFLNVHQFVLRLEDEVRVLKSLASPNASTLASLLEGRKDRLDAKGSWLAGRKLLSARQLIEEYLAVKKLLQYEITSAERQILQKRTMKLAPDIIQQEDLEKKPFSDSLQEQMIWWEARGDEYWADELGYYLYDIPSRCIDDKANKQNDPVL